jgi:hypothetical protein
MFSVDRQLKHPLSNRLRESAEKVESFRVTKNRETFLTDRLGLSASHAILEKGDRSEPSLPTFEKIESFRIGNKSVKKKVPLNQTSADEYTSVIGSAQELSHNTAVKETAARKVYLKTEKILQEKSMISSLLDPIVVSRIKKNRQIIDTLMDKERKKTAQARQSHEFTNVSFFRPPESFQKRAKQDRSNSPLSNTEKPVEGRRIVTEGSTMVKHQDLSNSQEDGDHHKLRTSYSRDKPIDYSYNCIVDRLRENNHPATLNEVIRFLTR